MNRQEWQQLFSDLDYNTLPLKPGGKKPHGSNWQRLSPAALWEGAPADANIGVRCGGGLAVLDADEPRAGEAIRHLLAGLGCYPDDYPEVKSASGTGRHFYVTLSGAPLDKQWEKWRADFGRGELRYGQGAYVVAPCSQVEGQVYELVGGDFRQRPKLDYRDLALYLMGGETFLSSDTTTQYLGEVSEVCNITRQEAGRRLSRKAYAILTGRADTLAAFASTSEAEQSLMLSLVNAGFDFPAIERLFREYPAAGKYAEKAQRLQRDAQAYLRRCFEKALKMPAESPTRQRLWDEIQRTRATAWPGRTGTHDRAVYLAHLDIAHRAGVLAYAAPVRRLAEAAGVHSDTASTATRRLLRAGRLDIVRAAVGEYGTVYSLNLLHTSDTSNKPCVEVSEVCNNSHDVWRRAGLGKAAQEVYTALPGSVEELAERTGRNRATVWRALKRMAQVVDSVTGEVLALAEKDGRTWRAVEGADLDAIARALAVAGKGESERKKHKAEQSAHRKQLRSRGAVKLAGSEK